METAKPDLIILSDYGLDDACALGLLWRTLGNYSKVFILCVAGNVSADTSLYNAKRLIFALGKCDAEVTVVEAGGIKQEYEELPEVHGGDGMGDLDGFESSQISHISYDEFTRILNPQSVILSLGPLTVTLDLLKRFAPKELIIMAGVTAAEPNFKGMEFNQALDEKAFSECVKYPHVIATLDTCRAEGFNLAGAAPYGSGVLERLVDRSVQLAEARHKDRAYIYDLIASLYLTRPQIFVVERVRDKWGNHLNELKLNTQFKLEDYLRI